MMCTCVYTCHCTPSNGRELVGRLLEIHVLAICIVVSGSAHTKLELMYNITVCTVPVTNIKNRLFRPLGGFPPLAIIPEGYRSCWYLAYLGSLADNCVEVVHGTGHCLGWGGLCLSRCHGNSLVMTASGGDMIITCT